MSWTISTHSIQHKGDELKNISNNLLMRLFTTSEGEKVFALDFDSLKRKFHETGSFLSRTLLIC